MVLLRRGYPVSAWAPSARIVLSAASGGISPAGVVASAAGGCGECDGGPVEGGEGLKRDVVVEDIDQGKADSGVADREFTEPPEDSGLSGEGLCGDSELESSWWHPGVGGDGGVAVQEWFVVDAAAGQSEQD